MMIQVSANGHRERTVDAYLLDGVSVPKELSRRHGVAWTERHDAPKEYTSRQMLGQKKLAMIRRLETMLTLQIANALRLLANALTLIASCFRDPNLEEFHRIDRPEEFFQGRVLRRINGSRRLYLASRF